MKGQPTDRPGQEKPRPRSLGNRVSRVEFDMGKRGGTTKGEAKGDAPGLREVNSYTEPFQSLNGLIQTLSQSVESVKGEGLVYYLNGEGVTVGKRVIRIRGRVMIESITHGGLVDIEVLGQGGEIT